MISLTPWHPWLHDTPDPMTTLTPWHPWVDDIPGLGTHMLQLGLTRKSLFEILVRIETRFLDPKFSRDFRATCESKQVARLASCESYRQKFHSENREKRVLLRNFVEKIASYEPRREKFRRKTSFSRVSQTNFVASLANRNFVARLTRIITNCNSGVLTESCEEF